MQIEALTVYSQILLYLDGKIISSVHMLSLSDDVMPN